MNPVAIYNSNILAIEDDPVLGAYLQEELQRGGFQVTWCRNGLEGLEKAGRQAFDVVLMDILLPGLDGLDALAQLRRRSATPVILMSALGAEADRISGFQRGADDYLPKPFAMSELLARVDVLARRKAPVVESGFLHHADIEIDTLARIVRRAGQRIELTSREFGLLVELVRNVGRVVTRSMLLERVWDYNFDPQTNIIDQHISNLRKKLEIEGRASPIQTVRGAGYMINP